MKYFTREMWEGLQGKNRAHWSKIYDRNLKNYHRQLKKLQPRLNKRTFEFFINDSLHDGTLFAFDLVDLNTTSILNKEKFKPYPYPVNVQITATNGDESHIYHLRYSCVQKMQFSFFTEEPLFRTPSEGLGWWGYDELTSRSKNFLRHEILFDSGATILLECKTISVSRKLI